MNVLILNGSPKREASDTLRMARAFEEGLKGAAQANVKLIHVIDRHIEYCKGCLSCMRNGGHCVIDDDMREILGEIAASDVIVFSFPLYCYGMPAPLKALVDRMVAMSKITMQRSGERYLHETQSDVSGMRFVLLCGCGFPNSKGNFEAAVRQFELLFPGSTTVTIPESPLFNVPEAASVAEPRLALLRRAGEEYANTGALCEETLNALRAPMIPEEVYAQIVNSTM